MYLCFFLVENFSMPENTRSCWPVRPIPRRSYVQDAAASDGHPTLSTTNAAIGVVLPTTPNTLHQHQNQLNEQLFHHNQQLLSIRVTDGVPQHHHQQQQPQQSQQQAVQQPQARNVVGAFNNNDKSVPMEDRLAQIQDYIRITTSLIDSINAEKVCHI